VVVHIDRLKSGHRQRLHGASALPAGVRLLAFFGEDRIYGIQRAPGAGAPQKEKPSGTEGFSTTPDEIPATSYSPTKLPWQYHRRWRA